MASADTNQLNHHIFKIWDRRDLIVSSLFYTHDKITHFVIEFFRRKNF